MKRTALVTGGASGLGRALAGLARKTGWEVAILDRDDEAGARIAAETGATFLRCDVASRDDWKVALTAIAEKLPPLGKVFLNAGVMSRPPSASLFDDIIPWLDRGAYERVMRVNVDGVLYGAIESAPRLVRVGGGSITVTASVAGLEGFSPDPFYSMSKHAAVGLVRSFGPIFEPRGVRMAAFCPGGVATPLVPQELAGAGLPFLEAADAAQSCWEVSERAAAGEIWVRASAGEAVHPYRAPPAFAVV